MLTATCCCTVWCRVLAPPTAGCLQTHCRSNARIDCFSGVDRSSAFFSVAFFVVASKILHVRAPSGASLARKCRLARAQPLGCSTDGLLGLLLPSAVSTWSPWRLGTSVWNLWFQTLARLAALGLHGGCCWRGHASLLLRCMAARSFTGALSPGSRHLGLQLRLRRCSRRPPTWVREPVR